MQLDHQLGCIIWYQSLPSLVLHCDLVKEPTARKCWGASEEVLGAQRGSAGGPITGIHEKRRGEPRKNGEMDWVKLSNVTLLTEQPTAEDVGVRSAVDCYKPNHQSHI